MNFGRLGREGPRSSRIARATSVMLVALVLLMAMAIGTRGYTIASWDFRNNLWGPAYLLVTGRSPYQVSLLFELGEAVWFPMVIGAFFPLGWLPLQMATNLWLVASLGLGVAIIWMSAESKRPAPMLLALALLATFLFPPTVTHLRLGQYSLFATFLFLLAVRYGNRLSPLLLGLLLALALGKPQLGFLVAPGLLLWTWRNQGLVRALSITAATIFVAAMLSLPLFLAEPTWPVDFLKSLQKNPVWLQPTLLTPLRLWLGPGVRYLWSALVIAGFTANALAWMRYQAQDVIYWSLAATTLLVPYVWSWDFVLLLPLFAYALFHTRSRLAALTLLAGYAFAWWLIVRLAYSAPNVSNDQYWWISWYFVLLIVVASLMERVRVSDSTPPRS